jgi:hypothetical protein
MNKWTKKYINNVSKLLPCSFKRRKKLAEELSVQVEDYLYENPQADYDAVVRQFGTPEDFSKAYVENNDAVIIGEQLKQKKRILLAVFVVALILAALISAVKISDCLSKERYRNGFYVETIYDTTEGYTEKRMDPANY